MSYIYISSLKSALEQNNIHYIYVITIPLKVLTKSFSEIFHNNIQAIHFYCFLSIVEKMC